MTMSDVGGGPLILTYHLTDHGMTCMNVLIWKKANKILSVSQLCIQKTQSLEQYLLFFLVDKFLLQSVCNIMKVCAFRRVGGRGWSHFLNQPLAPCLGTTRHKILADDKISMFQQRPLQRKCLSDGIFTSYFEWKENTAKNVYFGSLVNNKETKN